jgi:hypothetical protein
MHDPDANPLKKIALLLANQNWEIFFMSIIITETETYHFEYVFNVRTLDLERKVGHKNCAFVKRCWKLGVK